MDFQEIIGDLLQGQGHEALIYSQAVFSVDNNIPPVKFIEAEQVFTGRSSFFPGADSPFAEQFVFGQDMELQIGLQIEIKAL